MKHGVFGRKLGRNKDERRRLFVILTRSLLETGRVRTTLAKAKAVQPAVEKLITKAKRGTSGALRQITKTLSDSGAYNKLLEMAKVRFTGRTSGYTRIVRLGARYGDASEMVYLEFVDAEPEKIQTTVTKETKALGKDSGQARKAIKHVGKVEEAEVVSEEKPKKPSKVSKKSK